MRLSLTAASADRPPADLLVDVEDGATVAALRTEMARILGCDTEGLWLGGAQLDDGASVSEIPLREGALVALRRDVVVGPTDSGAARRGWNLHVVGGPDAGLILPLPLGTLTLGRGRHGLTDESLSRRHVRIDVGPGGATLLDLGSTNGTTLDGVPVPTGDPDGPAPQAAAGADPAVKAAGSPGDTPVQAGPVPFTPGQLVAAGDSLFSIVPAPAADAAVQPANDGTVEFTRPPRLKPGERADRIALPVEPVRRDPRRIPIAAMVAPLVLGIVIAVLFRQPVYLLFALATPIMAGSNALGDRRQSAKEQRAAKQRYDEALEVATAALADALAEETHRRRDESPDAAATVLTATLPTRRLWERRRGDADFLVLRVGTADLPSQVELTAPPHGTSGIPSGPRTVYAVPLTVPLADVGVLGIAGPAEFVLDQARWLLVQLGVTSGPRDVGLTVLAPRAGNAWHWVRWLPHAVPEDRESALASVGTDGDTMTARVAELLALIKARRDATRSVARIDRRYFPAHVVVLEGARALRGTPGVAQVLQDGPDVGVFAICLEEEERLLPEECTATVQPSRTPGRLEYRRTGTDPVLEVLIERITPERAELVTRAVAPLREVVHDDEDAALPESVRLLDVLALEPPSADAVRAHWQLGGRTTRLPIGAAADGTFALDLRRDGPHGLIAGTTGSGKSELLQSIIASLAVGNRPDEMNFVLVDYKGGSAFKDCVTLPHTVGMVTDLDAHLVERALTSLTAELRRREHQLAAADVKDIEDYTTLRLRGGADEPMPRLLIVIDEFASMARELPDFVTGLVNVAQRGRSLGIHLLLATQRPSGVVSAEIRANTNLRISLRVTDTADSVDVLEVPDAARIPKSVPGRAYVRLGHGALTPFQAGRVGGLRPGVRPSTVAPPFVAEVGWRQLGYLPPRPVRTESIRDDDLTDLSALVEAVRGAAQADGVDAQRSPWLPPLPTDVLLDDLPVPAATGAGLPPLPYGVEDRPAAQRQVVRAFDPASDGHLLAIGSPRSGRSQLLRTLAGAIARHSADDVHLYGLDCGNGALLPLTALPHCGAVVTRTQTERATRLLTRLLAELERRQGLLASAGYADIAEQRAGAVAEERLPYLFLFLDRWEGFTASLGEIDGGRLTEAVLNLLREGSSAGISLVLTGDRSLGSGRLGSLTENKLAFRLADRTDYGLLGLNAKQLPIDIPPGRAVATDSGAEVQVALLNADASGQGQAEALNRLAAAARERDAGLPSPRRPFRVDDLPARIGFEPAWEKRPPEAGPLTPLVGVGGDELTGLGPDLAAIPSFVVAGPGKSGRSTVLMHLAESLLRSGVCVLIGAPRPSPLRELAGRPGVVEVVTDPMASADTWRELLAAGDGRPLVVLLDDGEAFKDSPAGEVFRSVIKGMAGPGRALVLGGHADGIATGLSGWQVEAKKARSGVLLSPQQPLDGDLLGVRLPRSAVGQPVKPGRGLLHRADGQVIAVTIPDPT